MNSFLSVLMPKLGTELNPFVMERGLYTFINPHSYLQLRQHPNLLASFERIGVDGIALVGLLRVFLGLRVNRTSFDMTSLAPLVFRRLECEQKTAFLIGSNVEQMAAAKSRLLSAHPELRLAGTRSGYFDTEREKDESINQIVALDPDVVVVGMGTPLQEQYLVRLWQAGWRGMGYTCGGFFHQIAKKLDYYPAWIDRFHLRSAYRMWDEPRLVWRYGIGYPRAAMTFAADAVRFRQSI